MLRRRRTPRLHTLVLAALLLSAGLLGSAGLAAAALPTVDDFEAPLAAGSAGNVPVGWFTAQDSGSTVSFSRTSSPPAPLPGAPAGNSTLRFDANVTSFGVVIHNFENDAANQWVTQDWSSYAGFGLWVYGTNSGTDLFIDLLDNRNLNSTVDDAERYTVSFKDNFSGWRQFEFPFDQFTRKDIGNGAPSDGLTLTEVHGWAFGALNTAAPISLYIDNAVVYGTAPVRPLTVGFAGGAFPVIEGRSATVTVRLTKVSEGPVSVRYTTADGTAQGHCTYIPSAITQTGCDYLPASGTLTFAPGTRDQTFTVPTFDNGKFSGGRTVLLRLSDASGAVLGASLARIDIRENDSFDPALIDDFELPPDQLVYNRSKLAITTPQTALDNRMALPGQGALEGMLRIDSRGQSTSEVARPFAQSQDWSAAQGLSLWMYGNGTGKPVTLRLYDNRAPDPGPAGWELVWQDSFSGRAGARPNPDNWSYEIGDGTRNSNPGWGNSELQYYTDDPANAALDGRGNLLITARKLGENTNLQCYYGPCQYTSARLLTKHKAEFAYGRIEARIKVPRGAGLWPAFWSLGSDIDRVAWPQSGEIDFMEFVGRQPNRVFGTIHGPGYSGGESFGGTYDFPTDVGDSFHTFAVEWQPNRIVWTVDGIVYHTATPADVAPDQWVFNHSFFMLLNMAIGGNFGGTVAPDTVFPQAMVVDYVRVYQAGDTAERFETQIQDNFSGWRRVTVPFSTFRRSHSQPAGAPNDGLTLSEVWGYEIGIPRRYSHDLWLDQVRLKLSCPDTVTVTSTADSGAGSLRQALSDVCRGGVVRFAPALAGQTIGVSSGELTIAKDLAIDGAGAPGLTISGGGTQRVFVVNAGVAASIRSLTIADGYGVDLAGGVLVNGQLVLEQASVVRSRASISVNDFWKGGGGVYVGSGATFTARDSTISENESAGADGGGIYGFFESLVVLERSTVAGNRTSNVGAGLRTLGEARIANSTISGNLASGWHGGAIFHTDGVLWLVHSTVANNSSPAGTTGGIFVGTFTAAGASGNLFSSIVAGNSGDQCVVGAFGSGAVGLTSLGGNIGSDATCRLTVPGDQPSSDARLGALEANGGPTLTHLLLPGSPAINAASAASCPATDQRGVARPRGAGCDSGAVEVP